MNQVEIMARPKRPTPTQKITIRFDASMAKRLNVVSAHLGMTKSQVLEKLFNQAYAGWSVHTRPVGAVHPETPSDTD